MIRRRLIITGAVQGVWFRDSCRNQARRAGVAGWVRNRSDGSVEAIFEGAEADIELLIAWCHDGPAEARVVGVAVSELAVEGTVGFWIR